MTGSWFFWFEWHPWLWLPDYLWTAEFQPYVCASSILLEWRWYISNSTEPLACNQAASSNFILFTDGRMILTGDGRCSYIWCDFGPHKSGPFSALGNIFVFRQSGERVVISHWHADSRVVLWQSKSRNPTSQGRNLSLTCRFQGRTIAV